MTKSNITFNNPETTNVRLNKKALKLSYFTVGYNIFEGLISISAGIIASSIALAGFGLDSFIESLSGGIIIWRFSVTRQLESEKVEEIERKAVKLIGYTFFILSLYVLYESVSKLFFQEKPEPSLLGIVIAVVSCIVMPVLFYMKYNTGKALGSKALIADSKETLACVFLSFSLLVGLGLNYLFGLWWADPVVGLIVVFFLVREGIETLKEGFENFI